LLLVWFFGFVKWVFGLGGLVVVVGFIVRGEFWGVFRLLFLGGGVEVFLVEVFWAVLFGI
jgi:hypothetical protein